MIPNTLSRIIIHSPCGTSVCLLQLNLMILSIHIYWCLKSLHWGIVIPLLMWNPSLLHGDPAIPRICHARAHAWSKPCLSLRGPYLALFGLGPLCWEKTIKMKPNKTSKTSPCQCFFSVAQVLTYGFSTTWPWQNIDVFWPRPLNKVILELKRFLDNE